MRKEVEKTLRKTNEVMKRKTYKRQGGGSSIGGWLEY